MKTKITSIIIYILYEMNCVKILYNFLDYIYIINYLFTIF